jgi:hypothetical protein
LEAATAQVAMKRHGETPLSTHAEPQRRDHVASLVVGRRFEN